MKLQFHLFLNLFQNYDSLDSFKVVCFLETQTAVLIQLHPIAFLRILTKLRSQMHRKCLINRELQILDIEANIFLPQVASIFAVAKRFSFKVQKQDRRCSVLCKEISYVEAIKCLQEDGGTSSS